MSSIVEFGQRARAYRLAIPATEEEIALFSGLTEERVKLVEDGKDKSINALEITRLAFALGVTYQQLMFGK